MIINEYLVRTRHEELLAEAERARMVSLAFRSSRKKKSVYGVLLNWMGSVLCKWGDLLQERFGEQEVVDQSHNMDAGVQA